MRYTIIPHTVGWICVYRDTDGYQIQHNRHFTTFDLLKAFIKTEFGDDINNNEISPPRA